MAMICYVGKNNFQNEELTFKVAAGNDWWFHAKGCPGSHVIVKTNGEELPDRTFEEAARLAAYYSKNRGAEKAEIDYIERKFVKKVAGAERDLSYIIPTILCWYLRILPILRKQQNKNKSN